MGGVANSVVESLNANNDADDGEYVDDEEDAADDFNGEHEENDNGEHMEIDAEEQEFMENAEAIQDQDDSDKEEILYYSSEEETVKGMATSNFGRVKSFDHRPVESIVGPWGYRDSTQLLHRVPCDQQNVARVLWWVWRWIRFDLTNSWRKNEPHTRWSFIDGNSGDGGVLLQQVSQR